MSARDILINASMAIAGRAEQRDMPGGERSMARAVAAFNALVGGDRRLTEVEGWLFMVVLKAARATAGAHNLDDYVDLAGYAALAGECADAREDKAEAPKDGPFPFVSRRNGTDVHVFACCKYPNPHPDRTYCINCGGRYGEAVSASAG